MNITVTGATGFIGRYLVQSLARDGHSVRALSRAAWDVLAGEPPAESLAKADAVVHLAGSPVAQRWTSGAKKKIRASRVQGTHHLVTALSTLSGRPEALVCASAIGIYGDRGDEVLTEGSPIATGFLADVCHEWEQEADLAEALGIRVVKLRFGIALGRKGGALEKMLPPFRAFVGGKVGTGSQWMSWIHIADIVGLIRHAIEHPVSGVMNATAPNPVRNREFARELGAALHRPAIFPVPALALRILLGEMASVLVASQRVLPKAAESTGYRFEFPDLGGALRDLSS
ncbi:MAG TPA: TIGR01777 family oxidoreductase [Bryobacteraceae bacterium]|nr:TIGR01777 family oxidoreductase [Bryobacteraceae bacterium]